MALLRQIIGILYMLAILLLAFNIIYNVVNGIVPTQIKTFMASGIDTIDYIVQVVCFPIAKLVDMLLEILPPYAKKILPITQTDLMGVRIVWVPLISLFLYTYILKSIDDYYLSKKFDFIKKRYDYDKYKGTKKQ